MKLQTYEATIQTEAAVATKTQEVATQTKNTETQEPTVQKEGTGSLKSVTDEDKQELEK